MPLLSDVVRGSLVVTNLPEDFCFTTFRELILALTQYLAVEVPSTITNVVVSNVQPLDSQTNSVWFRISNAGGFQGIYVFSNGSWVQVFPAQNGVFWFMGNSTTPPDGYTLIDTSNTQAVALLGLPAIATLTTQYIQDPTLTFFVYFACTWTGM